MSFIYSVRNYLLGFLPFGGRLASLITGSEYSGPRVHEMGAKMKSYVWTQESKTSLAECHFCFNKLLHACVTFKSCTGSVMVSF